MRIVHASPRPPARDGVAEYAARLDDAYRASGHEVACVHVAAPAQAAPDSSLGALSFSPRETARLIRRIRGFEPDAIHVQHGVAVFGMRLLPLLLVLLACRLAGVPVVLTHHEITRDTDRLGRIGRSYYRVANALATLVHVHTRGAADRAERLGVPPSRLLVSPHPVYDNPPSDVSASSLLQRHDLDGQQVLLAFGFIHVEKGLRELVEGLGTLRRRSPETLDHVRLVIAGAVRTRPPAFGRFEQADRDYLDDVRSRVRRHDLHDHVVETGDVPANEVTSWFEAADVVVLPYTAAEQSGVANLAIAAGTPVLATATGGLGELFSGALPTFASLDDDDVAAAIETLVSDPPAPAVVRSHYDTLRAAASPAALVDTITGALAHDRGGDR